MNINKMQNQETVIEESGEENDKFDSNEPLNNS